MKGLILAAGLGTRLRPLTLERAKPSLPILGIPALWYGAWHLARELAPKALAINAGHAPDTLRRAVTDAELRRFTGVDFHVSDESGLILGSSGALKKLSGWIGNDLLAVCNADSISFPSWKKMADFHRKKKAVLTLHVRASSSSSEPYTEVQVDADCRITGFGPKTTHGLMFSGAYFIEPSLLARLPEGVSELRETLLEPLAREGGLYAFREDLEWFDTGTVAAYAEAQFLLLRLAPQARVLVEVKMREDWPDAWVPRFWKHGVPALKGPVVLSGDQAGWMAAGSVFGPRFIGIEPPPHGTRVPAQNAVVLSSIVEKI